MINGKVKILEINGSVDSKMQESCVNTSTPKNQKIQGRTNIPFHAYTTEDFPCGKSWDQWIQCWWKWCYAEPYEKSPVSDSTGKYCSQGQTHEKVWFLAGTFGGIAERKCEIPAGRALFFPVVNDLISFVTDPHLKSESDLSNYAKADLDHTKSLNVKIDCVDVHAAGYKRIRTSAFELVLPPANFNRTAIKSRAVSDGYWVFLQPLPSGYHIIQIKGEKLEYDKVLTQNDLNTAPIFSVHVTYHLTVK
jgi:hypothetical protein